MAEQDNVYLAQAKKHEARGDFAEAFSAYLKWAESEQTAEAYTEVGKLCEKYAEFRKAASMYSTALNLDASHTEAEIRLKAVQSEMLATPRFSLSEMRSLLSAGLVEKAVVTFVEAISVGTVDIPIVSEIARFLWRQDLVDRLADHLKGQREKGKVQDERLFAFAELLVAIYVQMGLEEIEVYIRIATESGLGETDVRYAVGVACASIGEFDRAVTQLERAFALSGGRRDMLLSLATAMFASGRHEEALQHFQRLASEFLENIDAEFKESSLDRDVTSIPPRLRSFFEEGLLRYDEGNFREASLAFHAGLSERTPPVSILLNLGICYIRQSQYDLAIRFLSRARILSPRHTPPIWNLAVALHRQGLLADSSRVLGEFIRISPTDRRALLCAGYLEHRLGKKEKVIPFFERILALPNPQAEVRIVCGTILHILGRSEEANKQFQVLARELFGEKKDEGKSPEAEDHGKPRLDTTSVPLNLNKRYYAASELYEIFTVLMDSREYDSAVEFFQRYASAQRSYVTPMLLLAQVHEQKGNVRKAYECLLEAADRNPQKLKANALVDVATFCLQHNMRQEAKSALTKALALNPQHQRANELLKSLESPQAKSTQSRYYNAAQLQAKLEAFIESGKLEEGVAFFNNYADQHLAYATPLLFSAKLLEQLGRIEEAASAYGEAIKRTPDVRKRAEAFVQLGKMYLEHQRYSESKEAFAEALSQRPDHAEAHRQLQLLGSTNPSVLYAYWDECRQTGQYEHALKYFQNLANDAPENHHLWLLIGYAYQNLGQLEQTYEAIGKAAELSQSDKIYEKLGWFCLQNQMYQRSKVAYEEALKINPYSYYAREGLSKISKAMLEGVPARTEDGKPTMPYLYAAWDRFRADSLYDQAIEYFRKLADEQPDFAPTYEFLGKAYEAKGEKRQGYLALLRMCEVDTSDENYIRLAAYCERNGLVEQAIQAYESVLSANPFNALAKKRLTVLKPQKYPGIEYLTGAEMREDFARDLWRKPWDRESATRLVEAFVRDRALTEAEKTFQLLQSRHPDQPQFVKYLSEVYQRLGEQEKALAEAQKLQPREEALRAEEAGEHVVTTPAESLRFGRHDLSAIAPKVAADWYNFGPDAALRQQFEGRNLKQMATEYYKKAPACDDAGEKARLFLISARVGKMAENPERFILGALLQYAKSMSEFNKFEGRLDLARAYLLEAARMTACFYGKKTKAVSLSQCVTDYLELASLMKSAEEIVEARDELLNLMELGRQYLGNRTLKAVLKRLGEITDAMAKYMQVEAHSDKELYTAQALSKLTDLRRKVAVRLKSQQQFHAFRLCSKWEDNLQAVRKLITGGAEVQLTISRRKVVPKGEVVPLFVDIKNEGRAPAENVTLRLMPSSDYRATDYEQTVSILPASKGAQSEFQLIPSSLVAHDFDVRFSVEYSDLYTGHKRSEFSAVISIQPEAQPFKPIISPYIAGPAIPPESADIFFGRQDVLRVIHETLTANRRDNILMLHGLRRVGKTSILNNLLKSMPSPYIPVLLDMQGFSGDDYHTGEVLFAIAKNICHEVSHRKLGVPILDESKFLSKPTYTFEQFVGDLTENLAGNRLFLMFDEFEVMIRKASQRIVDPNILDFMRNLMQHRAQLSFLFCGADQLLEMVASYASVMFNLALPIKIAFLDLDSARRLIEEPARRVGVEYHPIAVERILANTLGQPYFIQLICNYLIQRLNAEERRFVTIVDVESVMNELVTSIARSTHFDHLWDVQKVSVVDRLLMSCIAELSEHEMDWVRQERILELLQENGRETSEAQFVSSIVRLQDRDIVEEKKAPDGGLEYKIKVNLFRQWFRHHKPLRKILSET